ncbi:MAG: hypothetical protein WC389_22055 [Lutibacter sp.]|jgi:hypothetical protein
MNIKNEILKLKHGEKFIEPESDYGRAEIWCINDVYVVFEIPYLGGEPHYRDVYHKKNIDSLIHNISTWD